MPTDDKDEALEQLRLAALAMEQFGSAAKQTTISFDAFMDATVLVQHEQHTTPKKEEDEADSNERAFDFGD